MSAKSNHFKIGLFIITACIIATAGIVILGVGAIFEDRLEAETYFDTSVQGLDIGSPVKYRGVTIGRVEEINIAGLEYPEATSLVLVRFSISYKCLLVKFKDDLEEGLTTAVENGLRARITPQGVTGTAYLELDYLPLNITPPMLITWKPNTIYIPSTPSIIATLSQSLTKIMTSLDNTDLKGITDRLEASLGAAVAALEGADIKSLSDQAEGLLKELRVSNEQLTALLTGPEVNNIFSDAEIAASSAKNILKESEAPIKNILRSLRSTSGSINRLTKKLDTATGDIPEAVTQLRVTLKRLDTLLSIPQEDLEAAMQNIKILTENLKDLSETSKKYPSRVLFGEPPAKKNPGDK